MQKKNITSRNKSKKENNSKVGRIFKFFLKFLKGRKKFFEGKFIYRKWQYLVFM